MHAHYNLRNVNTLNICSLRVLFFPFSTPPSSCQTVIPENYLDSPYVLSSGKCVKKDVCKVFSTSSNDKQNLC